MDLKDFIPKSDTVEVTLKIGETVLTNPDGTPMTIVLYAPHTREYKKAQREQLQKTIKQAKESGNKEVDFDTIEDSVVTIYSSVTKSWNITYDGVSPKLSEKKAKQIYSEVFWIKDHIEAAFAETLDFMKI